jgi:PadR family transcriptional regulator, regulatory protein PadR
MPAYLGEFEQLLLLAVLRLGSDAYGLDIARDTSFDRLEDKGLLRWRTAVGTPARNGLPRRLYAVTPAGVSALRASRETLRRMWRGIDHLLKEPTS